MDLQAYSQNAEVRLVPVIEMFPTDYARTDRPIPFNVSQDDYFSYWSACLADSGIEGLKPIYLWLVPIEQLTRASTLEKIVLSKRFEEDPETPEGLWDRFSAPDEYVIAFNGGYALYLDDHRICTPRCCADLADIRNWQSAADYRGAEWETVWIGHPAIRVYYDGAHLVFLDQWGENLAGQSGKPLEDRDVL